MNNMNNIDNIFNSFYQQWKSITFRIFEIHKHTEIKIMCMFKKYLYKDYKKLLIPNSLLLLFNDIIDKKCREYYLINKYKNIWLIKYINSKNPINSTDLELNSIYPNSYKPLINYIDYDTRKRYLFTINDFRNIIKSSLEHSYSYDVYPEPIKIKNPYTNKEFSKGELKIINNELYDMPLTWHMFVDCDYDIVKFRNKYYDYLLPLCVPSYVEQFDDTDILEYLDDMFKVKNINYCEKCIEQRINIRSKQVKEILKEWIHSILFNKIIPEKYVYELIHIYDKKYCSHNSDEDNEDKKEDYKRHRMHRMHRMHKEENTSIEFFFNIDFYKPLFSVGFKTKQDIIDYKNKQRIKRIIKNRKNIKNLYLK